MIFPYKKNKGLFGCGSGGSFNCWSSLWGGLLIYGLKTMIKRIVDYG